MTEGPALVIRLLVQRYPQIMQDVDRRLLARALTIGTRENAACELLGTRILHLAVSVFMFCPKEPRHNVVSKTSCGMPRTPGAALTPNVAAAAAAVPLFMAISNGGPCTGPKAEKNYHPKDTKKEEEEAAAVVEEEMENDDESLALRLMHHTHLHLRTQSVHHLIKRATTDTIASTHLGLPSLRDLSPSAKFRHWQYKKTPSPTDTLECILGAIVLEKDFPPAYALVQSGLDQFLRLEKMAHFPPQQP